MKVRVEFFVPLLLFFGMEKAFSKDGKELFIESGCTKCHSVKAVDIKPQEKSLRRGRKIIDHSGVGLRRDDPEWIKKWLKKEVKNERGKKHRIKWKGSEEDLDILAKWLTTLKTEISREEINQWIKKLRKEALKSK